MDSAAKDTSKLSSSDVAFPRGGGTGLTSLEAKTISNKATEDVLFEQTAEKKRAQPESKGPQKKRKYEKKGKQTESEVEEKKVELEHFSFRTLVPGAQVLGQISHIAKFYMVLSLGDDLEGRIPITSISPELNDLLEQHEAESDDESDNDDDSHTTIKAKSMKPQPPKLEHLFHVGQWLRAVVRPNDDSDTAKIMLSIEPALVNDSMEEEDLVTHNAVQVAVKSVEDHGIVCNLGLSFTNGFIPNKALKRSELDLSNAVPGSVLLTAVVSKTSRTLNLRPMGFESVSKDMALQKLTSVDAVHPGCVIGALISDVSPAGVCSRVFGMMDGTMTFPHTNAASYADMKNKYGVAATVKARVIGTVNRDGEKKLLLSRSPKLLELKSGIDEASEAFPAGFVFESVEIVGFDSEFLYASTGTAYQCLVHKSKLDPEKHLEFSYSIGSKHRARVLGCSNIDNILLTTFNPQVIESQYASPEQIPIGDFVSGAEIIKIIPAGLIVKVCGMFTALVPTKHLSDIKLVYPERKFKVGGKVKGRILNRYGKQLVVTLRKSLVNMDDDAIIHSFDDLTVGFKTVGIVEKFVGGGAVISFFGFLRAFLPKSEISETFVNDVSDYLKIGQSVTARVLSISPSDGKFTVTLRQSTEVTDKQLQALEEITVGRTIVQTTIIEKSKEAIIVELADNNLKGIIWTGHLSDANYSENRVIYKGLNVGGIMECLVVDVDKKQRLLTLSAKKSLLHAAKTEAFPLHYEDIHIGALVPGFIKSVTNMGVFVSFAGKLTGLVLPKNASSTPIEDLSKVFYKHQSVACTVLKTDDENKRFLLSLNSSESSPLKNFRLKNPLDASKKMFNDFAIGTSTNGVIAGFEKNHISVRLADNLIARVHTSQAQDLSSIADKSKPFSNFKEGEKIKAKVIGYHNEVLNRYSSYPTADTVIELSILKDVVNDTMPYTVSRDNIKIGSNQFGVIDGYNADGAIFTIAPGLSGYIPVYNLSANVSDYRNFEDNFGVGTIMNMKTVSYDEERQKLNFSAEKKTLTQTSQLKLGQTYPAMVYHVSDSNVLVEFAPAVTAKSYITEALNDYDDKLVEVYKKGQCVLATILFNENGKVTVSLRDESSAKDKPLVSLDTLRRGDVVKGFVNGITKNGLYVSLGRDFYALVRTSNISDVELDDWQKYFTLFQTVTGKILQCASEGRISMTLKESEVNGDLSSSKVLEDLKEGEIYEGTVCRVADYGVFVTLDGTDNVRGLCHRSEISNNIVENAEELFSIGDRVKVKVLSVNDKTKRISLGMKASYFADAMDEDESEAENALESNSEDEEMEDAFDNESESASEDEEKSPEKAQTKSLGLSTNGFDWTASILDQAEDDESSDDERDFTQKRKKRKGKQQTKDRTEEMNAGGPESTADFERMIVGNPDSSVLWINYMSFQLQLGEIEKSREISERALKTINFREEQEKMNIWIALLNLENSFGSDESLDDAFKRSVQHMDSLTMHQKLVGIYVLSEKFDKAKELLRVMTKKFGQNVGVWVQAGSFFLERKQPAEAHEVLSRALQSLPKRDHIDVVRKFAQLEFSKGDAEQGRSLFEGLVTDAPKRIDLWNVYLDQEMKQGDRSKVESLFERVLAKKLSKKQAKFFFSKWLTYEEANGTEQTVARVKALAVEFVQNQQKTEG